MNTFMNLVKKSSVEGGTRGKIGAYKEVKTLIGVSLLPTLKSLTKLWLANSSCSLMRLVGELMQGFHQIQDLRAIAMEI